MTSILGQSISGKVVDEQQKPLPFASVYLKEAKVVTASNLEGHFILKLPHQKQAKRDTLVISYVGYEVKKVPFNGASKNKLTIRLARKTKELNQFVLKAPPFSSPRELIKKVLKKTKKNYLSKLTSFDAFYRETMKENGKAIELNEAALALNLTRYPQKRVTKRGFRKYWSGDFITSMQIDLSELFRHMIYFPQYVAQKDEAIVLSARTTTNNSFYGKTTSPVGGPLDLVALDKLKYQYDFFDPKLLKKYKYTYESKAYVGDELCYVVRFHPLEKYKDRVFQAFNKKIKYALYTGKLYVSTKKLAILKYEAQLALGIDFSVYKQSPFLPNYVHMEVNYGYVGDELCLKSVKSTQQKITTIGRGTVRAAYECSRELEIDLSTHGVKKEAEADTKLPVTNLSSLKFYCTKHDTSFWKTYTQKLPYKSLKKKEKNELTRFGTLSTQFNSIQLPISALTLPNTNWKTTDTIQSIEHPFGLNWMRTNEAQAKAYLEAENTYYQQVFTRLQRYRKSYYFNYLNVEEPASLDSIQIKKTYPLHKWKYDKEGHKVFYKRTADSTYLPIFDYTVASANIPNFFLEKLELNKKDKVAYSYSKKGEIANTLIVKREGDAHTIDSLNLVTDFLWKNDSTILYVLTDSTLRSYKLNEHVIGQPQTNDRVVYEEQDKTFDISIKVSHSTNYLFLKRESLDKVQLSYFKLGPALAMKRILLPFSGGTFAAEVSHLEGGQFVCVENSNSGTNRIFIYNVISGKSYTLYESTNQLIEAIQIGNKIVFTEYNVNGIELKTVAILTKTVESLHVADKPSTVELVKPVGKVDSSSVTVFLQSPIEPFKKIQVNLFDEKPVVLDSALNAERFLPKHFKVETVWSTQSDGTKVPVTLLYNTSYKQKFKGLYVQTYGAYGALKFPDFEKEKLVYAQKGILVAYVHVRGGSELGWSWYEKGKLLHKKNSFTDFAGATAFLQKTHNISPKHTIAYGTSAGGLVMGVMTNEYSDRFGGIIFDKPYLDVVNTMADSLLPLTTGEYKEWGNPANEEMSKYMLSYSPHQQIKQQKHPNLLFLSKYEDVQTPYWQVAQSVLAYRKTNQGQNIILFHTDKQSGHRGTVNQAKQLDEMANKYAFIQYVLQQ